MQTISMLEFRQRAEAAIRELSRGERMVLTYRGTPVARLEPIGDPGIDEDDSFYSIAQLADTNGRSLTNRQMDKIIYGA